MGNKERLQVGMKMYLVPRYNERYRNPKTGIIEKVGRDYFYIIGIKQKFNIDTLYSTDGQGFSSWQAWFSQEEYDLEQERQNIYIQVREYITHHTTSQNITLDKLKQIQTIINEK